MSLLSKYLTGWRFRTNRPSFDPGEEVQLFVTEVEDGTPIARVGDSFIHLTDGSEALVGRRVRIRIENFDSNTHVGNGTLLELVEPDIGTD